jgi:hypothetical protein
MPRKPPAEKPKDKDLAETEARLARMTELLRYILARPA